MLVSLSPSFNSIKKVNNQKNSQQINYLNQPSPKYNVSFGDGGASLIYLVAKGGLGVIKNGPKQHNLNKLLGEVDNVITYPYSNSEKLADTLSALSKIPDSIQTGLGEVLSFFSAKDPLYLNTTRIKAIALLSKTKDDTYVNIQSKKDFIRSLLDNGFSFDKKFTNAFEELNDTHYKSFKQEIISDFLYSKKYAEKEKDTYYKDMCKAWIPEADYNYDHTLRKLDIIETLNPTVHSEYLAKLQPTIIGLKKQIFSSLIKEPTTLPDKFLPRENKFEQLWLSKDLGAYDKYAETLWTETIKAYKYDPKLISKALNIPEYDVEFMLSYAKH